MRYYDAARRRFTLCAADDDDHCDAKDCPQICDGEPKKTGRHCPRDAQSEHDDAD